MLVQLRAVGEEGNEAGCLALFQQPRTVALSLWYKKQVGSMG
jgi:hypothetical protein